MLVFGGSEGQEFNNDVILFDLQPPAAHCRGVFCSTGSDKAPAPRAFHTAVMWRAQMIIFGGWNAKTKAPANDVCVWDCEKQTWLGIVDTVGPPPSPRSNHSTVIHGDKMIVFGGHNEHDRESDLHILNLLSRQPQWSGPIIMQGQVPRPVSHHTACLHGDKMLVFGDNGESPALFSLDLAMTKLVWKHLEAKGEIPQPRLGHTATMVGNHMVVLGGERPATEARQPPFANQNCVLDLTTSPATWSRLPNEGASPAARHTHTTVFHGPTMSMFMFGGTQLPTSSKKAPGRLKALLTGKPSNLRGLHLLPVGHLISPAQTALPMDTALQSTKKSMKSLRDSRHWFKDRIPHQFLRLASFLEHNKDDWHQLVQDINRVEACMNEVMRKEEALLILQAKIRAWGSRDHLPQGRDEAEMWDAAVPTERGLTALVASRDAARKGYLTAATQVVELVYETSLASKVQTLLVAHIGIVQHILALWDEDADEDRLASLIFATGAEADDVRAVSFLTAIAKCEEMLHSFLGQEARTAEELRLNTDSIVEHLQQVLLNCISNFMGVTAHSSGDEVSVSDLESDQTSFMGSAMSEYQSPADSADTLVRQLENVSEEEDVWFYQQNTRAEPMIPQARRVIRQLLRSLHCFEGIASGVLFKAGLVDSALQDMRQHGAAPPKIEDFMTLVDQVDQAQSDFCLAFAELDSLRKLRRRDPERITASEEKVLAVRRTLQALRKREEEERVRVGTVMHEHWPELLLQHSDLKLRDFLDEPQRDNVDGFLRSERSIEDYEIVSYNTSGRHVVLQAKFEDREYAMKEYVINDLETLKHEVRVLLRLQHPNVVPCQALLINESEMKAYLQLPFYKWCMSEWVRTNPVDDDIRELEAQVLSALSYLHGRSVVHGNVRLDNVMLDGNAKRAYLADFDVCRPGSQRAMEVAKSEAAGTPTGAVAPEVMAGEGGTPAADMWAFGYLIVQAQLRGRRVEKAIPQELDDIMRAEPFPTQLMEVVEGLFQEDPSRRMPADDAMLYRWFSTSGLLSEKEKLRRAVAEVQRERDMLRKTAIQLQMDRQSFREIQAQLLQRVEALSFRSADLVSGRQGHINTAQRLIFQQLKDALSLDLAALTDQWHSLAGMSDRLERFSREFAARHRELAKRETTLMMDKPAAEVAASGLTPIYWISSGARNLSPLVDVTDAWLSRMQELVTSSETRPVLKPAIKGGRVIRRKMVVSQVYHVENAPLWDKYCKAREVMRIRVAQASPPTLP